MMKTFTKVASGLFIAFLAMCSIQATAQIGCTDPVACNFDPAALTDDGTCCLDNCLNILVEGGTFDGEISWDLTSSAGVVVASGVATAGVPVFVCAVDDCYTFNMVDSFGDGWNGASYSITDELGTVLFSGDLDTAAFGDGASAGTDYLALPDLGAAGCIAGCVDPIACNYDAAATYYDFSCEYLSCSGCTDDGLQVGSPFPGTPACNYDATATLDDGSCDYACFGCTDGAACNFDGTATSDDGSCCLLDCYDITVGGGTFDGEISWNLTILSSGVVAQSGVAGTSVLCMDANTCYTFDMADSFGDGWNGATYEISQGGVVLFSGDLDTAAQGDGATFGVDLIDNDPLACPAGCTDDGLQVDSPFPGTEACNYDVAAVFNQGCEYDSCAGCTDPAAANFNPLATIDDGSCVVCGGGEAVFEISMTDTFGDGWNGAQYTVADDLGAVIAIGDLDNSMTGDQASAGSDFVCLAPGCYFFSVSTGGFDAEIGWALTDLLANDYGSVDAPFAAPIANWGVDFGGIGTCNFDGCTDPGCFNYNAAAVNDDGSCVCPPDNNDICDAEAVTCGIQVAGSTVNASDNEGLIGTTCVEAETSPGVWYEFNAAADQQIFISTCASAGGDSKITVYEAADCTSALNCVAGNDDDCDFLSTVVFNATTGNNYYIRVSEFGAGVGLDFLLDITCVDCAAIPTNDDCENALLQVDGVPFPGDLCCANPALENLCAPAFTSTYDVWFYFGSSDFDTFDFELNNGTGADVGMTIYEGGPEAGGLDCSALTALACCGPVTGTCAGDISAITALQPDTYYYFQVWTTDPLNCGSFDFSTSGQYLGCTDASADNFDPIATLDDGSCTYTTAPANDLCSGAAALPCNAVTSGSNGGATATDGPLGVAGCSAAPGPGVWYTFAGTGEFHTLSTCGSTIDTEINIYSLPAGSDCTLGGYTCVASELDGGVPDCGFFDQDDVIIEFISDATLDYYVYVGAADDGDIFTQDYGLFDIDFQCAPVVEGCSNPAGCDYDAAVNVDTGCDFYTCNCAGGPGTGLLLEMTDAFGDGWNTAEYTITNITTGVVAYTGDIDNAEYTIDEDNFVGGEQAWQKLCLEDGCYTLSLTAGDWPGEIGAVITDELGTILAEVDGPNGINLPPVDLVFSVGAAVCGCTDDGTDGPFAPAAACNYDPLATVDDGTCEYETCAGCTDGTACNFDGAATIDDGSCCFENCLTVSMTDSFGDGWNGNVYEIYDSFTNTLVASGDLDTADEGDGLTVGTNVHCLPDDCYYIVLPEGDGAFEGEVGWTLIGTNEGLLSGGDPTAAGDVYFSMGGAVCLEGCATAVACNYDMAVNIENCDLCDFDSCLGCTYPDADNYDAAAVIDDLSCTFTLENPCPADLTGDGIVNAADLLEFLGAFGSSCD